ncbi:hypothetical protein [Actimicrobium sp. CCI2.3]|uniref:hypothetical protein n=1 Tax=Actimicrobium sp. CCI2.3 TaxID=3048616 RepID=UPI002AB422F2|nr:hypothetical protein [Actimicrobium sp. CCI2.3]MDY7574987.1 hypothetical protein [Actimicrobium sp. CCI2.3]MEB0021442.1 hypothetical protein [Actimicrobium sp. CCI2.3]
MKMHTGRRPSGQSMVEYLLVCAALMLALGVSMIGPDSGLLDLITGFQSAYQNYSYSISLPE